MAACTPGNLVNAAKTVISETSDSGSSTNSSSSSSASKSWPASVTQIESKANQTVSVKGNFDDGQILSDLSWAANSSVACFPATQNSKFRGKHVFFATTLPPRSEMTIRVKPYQETADLSLYAYQIGSTRYDLVPNLSSAVSCEADHKWDYPKAGQPPQGSERKVFLNATTNPYNVVIGVTGPEGVTGEFTLEIELKQ